MTVAWFLHASCKHKDGMLRVDTSFALAHAVVINRVEWKSRLILELRAFRIYTQAECFNYVTVLANICVFYFFRYNLFQLH